MVERWRGFWDWGGLVWGLREGFVEGWGILAFLCLAYSKRI
ncbi:hypothetical protein RKD55_000663 [Rossellomorea marisflavi]